MVVWVQKNSSTSKLKPIIEQFRITLDQILQAKKKILKGLTIKLD